MMLRNSYFVGIMACALVAVSAYSFIEPAHAETLKITGPNGEVNSTVARQYGPTTSADTFWSIAQKVRPNSNISIYQVMAALFDANPHAFSSDNYNSLERGMTLLVPSADVMGQISKVDAKVRAENNDKRLPNANQTPNSQQTVTTPAVQPKAVSPQKPLQIIAEKPKETVNASQPMIDELTIKLEDEQNKSLSLTDELARSEDMLMIKDADNVALKSKIQELTLQLSMLQEDFQLLSEKQVALETAHKQLIEETSKPAVVEEPADFWRSLSDNMLLLAIAAALPLILIFLFIFWLMRRKNNQSSQDVQEPINNAESNEALAETNDLDNLDNLDDIESLAIHLDDDESSDELTLDEPDNAEMYIVEEEANEDIATEEDEGTSLDDLWAEAMEEQEDDLQPLESDEEDFDSLLDGLDELPADVNDDKTDEEDLDSLLAEFDMPAEEPAVSEPKADPQDDIDSLLADFDLPAEESVVEDSATEVESAAEAPASDPQDDIDSLLADFDLPAEESVVEDSATEVESAAEAPASDPQDDIDSLLADFDLPAEEPVIEDSETEVESTTEASVSDPQDDIDSLLADLDLPAEESVIEDSETEVESTTEASVSDPQDDIDSLLADFDLPAEEPVIEDSETEVESTTEASVSDPQDDIDSLLADFDLPAEEPVVEDSEIQVKAAEASVSDSQDDIDNLLASIDVEDNAEVPHDFTAEIAAELEDDVAVTLDETDNIDELIAEVDTDKEFSPLVPENVEQELTSELEQIESDLEIDTDNTDIDSLISDLETEVPDKAEESFEGADDFAAQIAAELEQEDDQETLDTDLDALLADLDTTPEPVSNDTNLGETSTDGLTFATGDEATLDIEDDAQDNPLVNELLAAEKSIESDSAKETNTDIDDLDALLADFDVDKLEDDEQPLFTADDNNASEAEFDTMLAGLSATDETDLNLVDENESLDGQVDFQAKESGFFDDLKSTKTDSASLDWEAELFKQASNQDSVNPADDSNEDQLIDDSLIEDNLTVEEALAALDAKESKPSEPTEDALASFEKSNDYIDIDALLNDADEVVDVSDQYKDVEVDVGEVNALIGNAEMIDVDDEENSVNAKLDLARAYIEIEDEDSAKALLAEVNIDGNERQQVEATKLLSDMK
ncbi:FimV/HubP family polar landmark protein [Shewanella donghaensis]|uniref:FimV/HubP family polar landmark protein n=1 Tax=Shewanella donghaensis TaxID=238836 RepID=UPI00118341A8|nr:FimV/HubP family polar landmark protein [Shewanella donghaensis]